jgi:ABC-2 type transport system permease protein
MSGIWTLLKLDLKTRFGVGNKITKKSITSILINLLFTLIIYAVYVVGLFFITNIMLSGDVPLKYAYLVIATGVSMLVQAIVCTGMLIRNLYYDGDNELLLRFPVDGSQIFAAKAILVFILNLIVAYALTMPIYVMYGIITHAGASFYWLSFLMVAVGSVLPYCLSNLVAIPVINLTNFLKNRFALILSLMVITVVFGFIFYMLLLKGVLEYAKNKSPALLPEAAQQRLRDIASGLYPFSLYANVLYGENPWVSMIFVLLINAFFMALAFIVSKKTVMRMMLDSIERESQAFEVKSTESVRHPFAALLRKEYILIFRSLNYSFQYFTMAITAPFMVYFCNDLASSIGDASVGGRIIPGLTMLVVIIFITIIVSFASTSVSREGNTFYLTKIMPVSYTFQVLVKLILYTVVATASVLISCIVVGAAFSGARYGNFVKLSDILSIFAIAELLIWGLSAKAIRSDLKTPTFAVSKNGELASANKNASANMLIGCTFAVFFGLITMIFSYIPLKIGGVTLIDPVHSKKNTYALLLVISGLFAAHQLCRLFFRLDAKYNKIKVE